MRDPALLEPGTGVGGGRKVLLGTAECAPPGGGARDVKFIPAACEAFAFWKSPWEDWAEEGNSGAGGKEKLDLPSLILLSKTFEFWIVADKLASKLATASADSVCENESGGNGTLFGAGFTNDGYG